MIKKIKSVTSHVLFTPLPLSQTVTPSRTPPLPSSVTYFMDGQKPELGEIWNKGNASLRLRGWTLLQACWRGFAGA